MIKFRTAGRYIRNLFTIRSAIRIFLSVIASLILVIHAETLQLKYLIKLKGFLSALIFTSIAAFIIIEVISFQNEILNRKYRWESVSHQRFIRQILQCIIAPIAISFLLATVYFGLNGILIFDSAWFSHYSLPITLFIFILNLLYLAKDAYILLIKHNYIAPRFEPLDKGLKEVKLFGNSLLPYSLDDKKVKNICYIKTYAGTRVAFLKDGEQFAWPYAIEDSVIHLPPGRFIEINRTEIIEKGNISEITEKERIFLLLLKYPIGSMVKVSQRHSDTNRLYFQHLQSKLKNKNNKIP